VRAVARRRRGRRKADMISSTAVLRSGGSAVVPEKEGQGERNADKENITYRGVPTLSMMCSSTT
jgi:hypothetical protein